LGLAAATALISAHGVFLARATAARPPHPPSLRASALRATVWPSSPAPLARETHDPYALYRRAASDAARGEVVLSRVHVRPEFLLARPWEREIAESLEAAGALPPSAAPGMRLTRIEPGWFLGYIGLRAGDVVTSFNGYPMDGIPSRFGSAHLGVIDVLRGRQRVVLVVSWP
jgi:hypothetical protein